MTRRAGRFVEKCLTANFASQTQPYYCILIIRSSRELCLLNKKGVLLPQNAFKYFLKSETALTLLSAAKKRNKQRKIEHPKSEILLPFINLYHHPRL